MVSPLIKEFVKEKIVLLNSSQRTRLPFPLEGVTRIVDKKGHMLAVVFDKEVWSDFQEYLKYSDPKFWEEIELSRKSGRVSAEAIEKRLGIK